MRLRGTVATRGDVVARDGTQLLANPDEALCGVDGHLDVTGFVVLSAKSANRRFEGQCRGTRQVGIPSP